MRLQLPAGHPEGMIGPESARQGVVLLYCTDYGVAMFYGWRVQYFPVIFLKVSSGCDAVTGHPRGMIGLGSVRQPKSSLALFMVGEYFPVTFWKFTL